MGRFGATPPVPDRHPAGWPNSKLPAKPMAALIAGWFGLSVSSLAGATIFVYDNSSSGSLSLSDQSAAYSGSADFDLSLSVPDDETAPCGLVRALSHYGPSAINTTSVCFQTIAFTSAERRTPRSALTEASWEFTVGDADTIFEMFYVWEAGAISWALEDLTLNSVVATDTGSGGFGGNRWTGTLLLDHSYQLTQMAQTGSSSDELAQMDFWVGADVVFLESEIELDSPAGVPVASGGAWDGGTCIAGETQSFTFTIRNTGEGVLSGLAAVIEGADAAEFSVSMPAGTTVPPGGSVAFSLTAAPSTGGSKAGTLRITSNDADENPYLVQLSAFSLSSADDSDHDGMNDAGEFKLSSLGFDWQVAQSEMVAVYFSSANTNGLYTTSQVQALHVGSPLLARDPASGIVTLTLQLYQSADLLYYEPMPMDDAIIDEDGKLVFRFSPPGNTAFYRLSAR